MRKRKATLSAVLCAALLLAGCAAAPRSSPAAVSPFPAAVSAAPTPTPTPSPTPLPANWHRIEPAQDGSVTLAFTGDVNFADDWYIMQKYYASGRTDFAENFSPDLLALIARGGHSAVQQRVLPVRPGRTAAGQGVHLPRAAGQRRLLVHHGRGHCLAGQQPLRRLRAGRLLDTLDVLKGRGHPLHRRGAGPGRSAAGPVFYCRRPDHRLCGGHQGGEIHHDAPGRRGQPRRAVHLRPGPDGGGHPHRQSKRRLCGGLRPLGAPRAPRCWSRPRPTWPPPTPRPAPT